MISSIYTSKLPIPTQNILRKCFLLKFLVSYKKPLQSETNTCSLRLVEVRQEPHRSKHVESYSHSWGHQSKTYTLGNSACSSLIHSVTFTECLQCGNFYSDCFQRSVLSSNMKVITQNEFTFHFNF